MTETLKGSSTRKQVVDKSYHLRGHINSVMSHRGNHPAFDKQPHSPHLRTNRVMQCTTAGDYNSMYRGTMCFSEPITGVINARQPMWDNGGGMYHSRGPK